MASISVKIPGVKVAIVIDRVDGIIIFDLLHPHKTQPFVQSYSPLIKLNNMQIKRTTILDLLNAIHDPIDQYAPQSAPSNLARGTQSHDVKHFGIPVGVGHQQLGGFVAIYYFGEGGAMFGGGEGGGEEGADDAAYYALSDCVVVWSFGDFVVVFRIADFGIAVVAVVWRIILSMVAFVSTAVATIAADISIIFVML